MSEEKSIPSEIKCKKSFFTVKEVSQKTGLHRNTISNMIKDERLTPTLIGKRNMIHISEINRIISGSTSDDEHIKLDLEIALKMSELEALLHKRMSIQKDNFLDELKKISRDLKGN